MTFNAQIAILDVSNTIPLTNCVFKIMDSVSLMRLMQFDNPINIAPVCNMIFSIFSHFELPEVMPTIRIGASIMNPIGKEIHSGKSAMRFGSA